MKIHNVRLGLATNSSSTHSLIFLPDVSDDQTGTGFGWGEFTLSSEQSKRDYFGAIIYTNLQRQTTDKIALVVAKEWSKGNIDEETYIDHQSYTTLPREWSGRGLDTEFLEDFKKYLLTEGVVVLGGNDNDGSHYLKGFGDSLEPGLPTEDYSVWVARKDSLGYWVIFNRETGAKLRFTLNIKDGKDVPAPDRASRPELVDIKITDFCPYDCDYCYQGSTATGKHANLDSLSYLLGEMKVFEVAIGGGEPTLHPKLNEFLYSLHYRNVVANITTKNLTWIKAEALDLMKDDKLGAFAFSVDSFTDVKKLYEVIKQWPDKYRNRASVQYIIGANTNEWDLNYILRECANSGLRITLLGYKTTGRGKAFGEKPSSKWLNIVRDVCKEKYLRVGIDTVLADKHWDDLIKVGVPSYCMTRYEGKYSCYIDAVNNTIGPSSYCAVEKMVTLPKDVEAFEQVFKGF